MIDLTGITHHPAIEDLVEVLCNKTQNTDKGFFRVEAAYFLGKLASNMRAIISPKIVATFPSISTPLHWPLLAMAKATLYT